MPLHTPILSLAAICLSIALAGCSKPEGGAATAGSGKPTPGAASNLPVKGPWDAIKITLAKKNPDGSANFKVENVGAKTVTQIYIDVYGYDAKGKQVAHKDLGFSLPIKGGASDDFTRGAEKDVDTWEATYHGIAFEGEKDTMDYKRAPAQRPKGG